MCGGGGGGDGGAGRREQERQQRVREGIEHINRIFDGHMTAINPVSNPEIGGNYFLADGTQVSLADIPRTAQDGQYQHVNTGMIIDQPRYDMFVNRGMDMDAIYAPIPGTGVGASDTSIVDQAGNPIENQASSLFGEMQHSGGFDDDFYEQRRQAYLDFALPQLEDQYADQKENLLYALARNGRLNSSTRSNQLADLQQQYNVQRTNMDDDALAVSNRARADIENARSNLVSQASSLADPEAIRGLAQSQAQSLISAPDFDPVGTLFTNAAAGLTTAAEARQRQQQLNNLSQLYTANLRSDNARVIGG